MARVPNSAPVMFRWLILLLISALVVSCAPAKDPNAIVVWTAFEGAELDTLRQVVDDFQTDSGMRVELLKVPFTQLSRKMMIAGPAEQGPDLLIGPHDWIGILQTAGLLAPIPERVASLQGGDFYEICEKAGTFDGAVYSAPMMLECVVLARNTKLCPEEPKDLETLVEVAKQAQQGKETLGFAYRLDDFYFTWAFLAGFGADFLEPLQEAEVDLKRLDFATPEAQKGANWVASLREEHGLVPDGMENDLAVEFFLKGRLGMMLCGPWNLAAIRQSGVPYSLEPLPPGPAGPSSPFVGMTGVMLSRYAVEKSGVEEMMKHLTSPETIARLCQASGRAPARKEAARLLSEMIPEGPEARDLELFSRAAQLGTPVPNHPAMSAVWEPMKQGMELITSGKVEAEEELQRVTERVRSKIRFMTE